jgi:hypothetical protein
MTAKVYSEKDVYFVTIIRTDDGLLAEAVSKFNYPLIKEDTPEALKRLGWMPPENESDNWNKNISSTQVRVSSAAQEFSWALGAYDLEPGEAISLAGLPHRDPTGEEADLVEDNSVLRGKGGRHARGILRLDADHLHVGAQELGIDSYTRSQPPPPMGTNTAPSGSGCWRRISMPMVPCPAMTSGSSYRWTNFVLFSTSSWRAWV